MTILYYYLLDDISWRPNDGQERFKEVSVPKGFVTDLRASRAFSILFCGRGNYAYAAVVHDYLYWFQQLSRFDSDRIFKWAMQDLQISP